MFSHDFGNMYLSGTLREVTNITPATQKKVIAMAELRIATPVKEFFVPFYANMELEKLLAFEGKPIEFNQEICSIRHQNHTLKKIQQQLRVNGTVMRTSKFEDTVQTFLDQWAHKGMLYLVGKDDNNEFYYEFSNIPNPM